MWRFICEDINFWLPESGRQVINYIYSSKLDTTELKDSFN